MMQLTLKGEPEGELVGELVVYRRVEQLLSHGLVGDSERLCESHVSWRK